MIERFVCMAMMMMPISAVSYQSVDGLPSSRTTVECIQRSVYVQPFSWYDLPLVQLCGLFPPRRQVGPVYHCTQLTGSSIGLELVQLVLRWTHELFSTILPAYALDTLRCNYEGL